MEIVCVPVSYLIACQQFIYECMCLPGENVVPEPEDEAEAGGPRSALRVPVRPGGPVAACAVSAPLPGWTAPGTQRRLLPATAAAVRRGPAGRSAPRPYPSAPLLSPVCLPNYCLESRYSSVSPREKFEYDV